jgi:hypothetical protein
MPCGPRRCSVTAPAPAAAMQSVPLSAALLPLVPILAAPSAAAKSHPRWNWTISSPRSYGRMRRAGWPFSPIPGRRGPAVVAASHRRWARRRRTHCRPLHSGIFLVVWILSRKGGGGKVFLKEYPCKSSLIRDGKSWTGIYIMARVRQEFHLIFLIEI